MKADLLEFSLRKMKEHIRYAKELMREEEIIEMAKMLRELENLEDLE